jgi:hypothetical protein
MMSDLSAGMPLALRAGAASALCGPFMSAAMADELSDCKTIVPSSTKTSRFAIRLNCPGAIVSAGIRENVWPQGMIGSIKAQYHRIKALFEGGFYDDLNMIDVRSW